MREIEQILQLWQQARKSDEPAVLATVVRTQGSSYRLPGARLLLLPDGRRAGSISGGCLEGDLLTKGWWLTEAGPVVRRYDTTADGEIGTGGFGLGCNGIIHVLIERLQPGKPNILDVLAQVRSSRQPAVVCHLIGPPATVGGRLLLGKEGVVTSSLSPEQTAIVPAIEGLAREGLLSQTSSVATVAGLEVFVETLLPPVRLLVFGAGDDAIPLTEIAAYLGWPTCIYDGRAHLARAGRFRSAEQVTLRPLGGTGVPLPVDRWTVAVLMTHSYSQDLDILRELAASPTPRYVGILGPRKRTRQLLSEARLDPSQLGEVLHSPMGLDIGADGPEQVAIAVVAEIQGVLHRRQGGHLRDRRGSIHADQQAGEDANLQPAEDQDAEETQVSGADRLPAGSIACA
jgi:xanthine dehydrogenase accessory factor